MNYNERAILLGVFAGSGLAIKELWERLSPLTFFVFIVGAVIVNHYLIKLMRDIRAIEKELK